MKKNKKHSSEEIIKKLKKAEGMLAAGHNIEECCREIGVSPATLHRWKKKYGGMDKPEIKRLRELGKENQRLKKMLADKMLDIEILEEVARGKW